MRFIKLYAYHEYNLGDDLMIHILLKRYPQYIFFCEDCAENYLFEQYDNFLTIPKIRKKLKGLNEFTNKLTLNKKKDVLINRTAWLIERLCCCAVYIGGSLYMQHKNWHYQSQIEFEGEKCRKKLFVIGANFGPYWDADFKTAFEAYFRKCAGITFRDQYSYELFKKTVNHISYAPDVVFNLDKQHLAKTGNNVLISVIDVMRKGSLAECLTVYEDFVVSVCKCCVSNGEVPVLMSFCKSEGDEEAIERILQKIPQTQRDKVEIFKYSGNIEEALALFEEAKSVLATRFHAMILAICFGKPFFSLVYNEKVEHYLQDLNCSNYCRIQDIYNLHDKGFSDLCKTTKPGDRYFQEAEKQFAQFDAYMRK